MLIYSCEMSFGWCSTRFKIIIAFLILSFSFAYSRPDTDEVIRNFGSSEGEESKTHRFKPKVSQTHINKLKQVNGFKYHNVLHPQKEIGGLIYINNPVEARIPKTYLTVEEFKEQLNERAQKDRLKPTTKAQKFTITGKRNAPTRTTLNHNTIHKGRIEFKHFTLKNKHSVTRTTLRLNKVTESKFMPLNISHYVNNGHQQYVRTDAHNENSHSYIKDKPILVDFRSEHLKPSSKEVKHIKNNNNHNTTHNLKHRKHSRIHNITQQRHMTKKKYHHPKIVTAKNIISSSIQVAVKKQSKIHDKEKNRKEIITAVGKDKLSTIESDFSTKGLNEEELSSKVAEIEQSNTKVTSDEEPGTKAPTKYKLRNKIHKPRHKLKEGEKSSALKKSESKTESVTAKAVSREEQANEVVESSTITTRLEKHRTISTRKENSQTEKGSEEAKSRTVSAGSSVTETESREKGATEKVVSSTIVTEKDSSGEEESSTVMTVDADTSRKTAKAGISTTISAEEGESSTTSKEKKVMRTEKSDVSKEERAEITMKFEEIKSSKVASEEEETTAHNLISEASEGTKSADGGDKTGAVEEKEAFAIGNKKEDLSQSNEEVGSWSAPPEEEISEATESTSTKTTWTPHTIKRPLVFMSGRR